MPRSVVRILFPAVSIVALCSLGGGASRALPVHVAAVREGAPTATTPAIAQPICPTGTLPDMGMCLHLPDDDEAPDADLSSNAHRDSRGRWTTYDEIPRRPDRPAEYDRYRYPVPCEHLCVVSGYDLDRPDEAQRRGPRSRQVGHGAVDLPQPKGTLVTMVSLDHQKGDAQVVYVGPLFGTTVVTRHTLLEGGQLRDYVLVFGHLDAAAPGVLAGALLGEGAAVGFVGDTGSPELVHLHLEARRMRDGVDVTRLGSAALVANENSVVCDPRNVLPLR
jgi:murein DD-endopeptidase MepM/ murein hydrolase activator NlpD